MQLSGANNIGSNIANINVTKTAPGSILPSGGIPTGSPCSSCQAQITANLIQVSAAIPGTGTAAQQIGTQSILQGINVNGFAVSATNSLNMVIQVGHPVQVSNIGLATVLQAIPQLPH